MICKMCGNEKLLVKSHFFPRALSHDLRGATKHLKVLDTKTSKDCITQSGESDDLILCGSCEASFNACDTYAVKFLRDETQFKTSMLSMPKMEWYELSDYNYQKLKHFVLGVIWRSSVSKHRFGRNVSLGPYEQIIKEMLLSKKIDPHNQFPVIISKFHPDIVDEKNKILDLHKTQSEPVKEIMMGSIFYMFCCGGFQFQMKVGNKRLPVEMDGLLLTQNPPLRIAKIDFSKTGFFRNCLKAVQERF